MKMVCNHFLKLCFSSTLHVVVRVAALKVSEWLQSIEEKKTAVRVKAAMWPREKSPVC